MPQENTTPSNTNDSTQQQPPLTQEERDRQSAERYRAQLDGDVRNPSDGSNEVAKPERPAHVPEKFWDAEKGEVRLEELTKSYAELEKKTSQKPAAKPQKDAVGIENGENGEGEQNEGENNTPDPVAEAVKGFNSLREQATAKLEAGEPLTDEMYQGFEKHGLSRDDVDAYVAGQEALGRLAAMEVHGAVGGEDEYRAMIEWARVNFDAKEIEVYDRDIHSSDSAVRLTAAKGLAARYKQAVGKEGVSVTSGRNSGRANEGYASGAEMRADMRDPRYKTDEAFRESVARKAAASRRAGVDLSM